MNTSLFCRGLLKFILVLNFSGVACADDVDIGQNVRDLKAVYATQSQGYPSGPEDAKPDPSIPFRWHAYDETVHPFNDAKMSMYVEAYNPLEDEGVSAEPPVRFDFVADHATCGQKALRAQFTAEGIRKRAARIQVKCVASPILSDYWKYRRSAYWSHFRWLRGDAFNASEHPLHVLVCGVPLVLAPGPNRISVKTVDAVGDRGDYPAWFMSVPIEVGGPERDVVLYLDNFRMEQEVPKVVAEKGRLFQFPVKGGEKDSALMLWPGFTPIERDTLYTDQQGFGWVQPATKRSYGGLSFRSNENGLIWGRCENVDSPLRFDVPNGRWRIWLFATPIESVVWSKGAFARVNGQSQPLFAARSADELRRTALAGELWDFRPGACLWFELVRDAYFPRANFLTAEVNAGHVLLDLPPGLALRAVLLFPEEHQDEALREIGRLEYLLAESWDVSHAWVRGACAERDRYIGAHEEMIRPETVPHKIDALKLAASDFNRGFLLFQRGLTDAVYPDTIPTPSETKMEKVAAFSAPGESECFVIGLLPLVERKALQVQVSDLVSAAGTISKTAVDVRMARYHHKCMEYGHHNHNYNFEEHFLVHRPKFDIYRRAARRIYFDIAVPPDAKPGLYRGEIQWLDTAGSLATTPLELEVLPVRLEPPAVFFGTDNGLERGPEQRHLRRYGINFIGADYDTAAANGFAGYAVWPYDAAPPSFKARRFGWSSFVKEKEHLGTIIAEGKSGRGPRGFFGGYVLNKPSDQELYETLVKEFPNIDILGVTIPVYSFHGADYPNGGEQWRSQVRTRGKPELLEQAAASGKEFWFFDWMRHSKEQAARFSFGFWLWRLGAKGRYTTFSYGYDYHYGTARRSYPAEPYYTMLGVVGGNACPVVKPALHKEDIVLARDLLLIREGITDYKYIDTLDRLIRSAESKKLSDPAVAAAAQFRDQLRQELSLDLTRYYESRSAAYAENWYPRAGNPWTDAKFNVFAAKLRGILSVSATLK